MKVIDIKFLAEAGHESEEQNWYTATIADNSEYRICKIQVLAPSQKEAFEYLNKTDFEQYKAIYRNPGDTQDE